MKWRFQLKVIFLPFKIRIHTKFFISYIRLGKDISQVTAKVTGYRKSIYLSEQLTSSKKPTVYFFMKLAQFEE